MVKKSVRFWLVTTVAIVAVASAIVYGRSNSSEETPYQTLAVERGPVAEKALAVGSIGPRREIAVKSKISGIVKRSFREIGDLVRAGDPLFEILPDPTPWELTEARREVEIASTVHEQARKGYERAQALEAQGIISSELWEQAERAVEEAGIRLELAQEKLALTEDGRIQSATMTVESIIRAPIDGTVLELLVNEGDPVVPLTSFQAGTPLASLADMTVLLFKGTVDEIDVGKLSEGMPARIKVGALPDANVEGRVYKIAPKSRTEEGTTLFDVEIELIATDVVLRAGYSANADLVVQEKPDALLIPERLVTFGDGAATVEVPGSGPDADPVKQVVELGLSDGLNVEITTGLDEGDLVVERPPKQIEG
jgi:HlyD family secretion protein